VFVDLKAACDTVWHRGLTCKLMRLLPNRHMVRMIMEMVGDSQLYPYHRKQQKKQVTTPQERRPTGICPGALLFNIYISDLPTTICRKYAYADDVEIMHADLDWQAVEGALSKDMATLGYYLQTWKLKLSTTKTVLAAFHLNNKEAKRERKINYKNETLPFCSEPKYL